MLASKATTRFELSAGGIVCRQDRGQLQVALIATHGGERWTLPKGLVEHGESLEEAARREVREETGLEGEIIDALEPIEYWFWWGKGERKIRYHKKVCYFVMRYQGGRTEDHDAEVDDVRWFPIDEAIGRVSYETERELLRRVRERLSASA